MSKWDFDILSNDFSMPDLMNFGFKSTEFPKETIEASSKEEKTTPNKNVPQFSKKGDLFQLNDHVIKCADCTVYENWEDVTKEADMVFTDPPYALMGNSTGTFGITDNKMIIPFFRNIFETMTKIVGKMAHVYVCCDWRSWSTIESCAQDFNVSAHNMIVWDKISPGMGGSYMNQHELIFFGNNNAIDKKKTTGAKYKNTYNVSGSNIWQFKRVSDREHNAQKPVDLVCQAIRNSSSKSVVDMFLGSGTTLIAAEQTGRTCYGMEIEPKNIDIIIHRYWLYCVENGIKCEIKKNGKPITYKAEMPAKKNPNKGKLSGNKRQRQSATKR